MLTRLHKFIGTISGLSASLLPLMAGNMLTNPGFESDPIGQTQTLPGWSSYGGNAYSETSPTAARSGTNYFKVYQAFNGQLNYTGIYQDYISGPGATYTADGWAKTISTDVLAGQNAAWIEVTFRDANANVLALHRSSLITTNDIATGAFPKSNWTDLPITNQCNPNTYAVTNTTARLVAPPGTYFVRYQVVFQGDAAYSGGSVYFDDLTLNLTSAAPYGDWNIVWSDEFSGTVINTNTWTYNLGAGGWGNNELEYYTSRTNNAYVAGGLLHIVAKKEATNGASFTSARMLSQGRVSWRYGRFEWRARFPAGTGFWPALWLLGTNITSVGWPGCGEIDVMENSGAVVTNVQGSLHSGSDETAIYTFPAGGSVTNFHTYVLDWNTNAFLWYVDGQLYQMQTNWWSSLGAYPTPFDKPCFIIMNLAVGGNYLATNGVNPSIADINKSTFPAEMQVDYVRVYNPTAPLKISLIRTNNALLLSWPSNIVGHVQTQFNPPDFGLGTNWSDQSPLSNPFAVSPTNSRAFYRLQSP
jgi:beta-glucanase (GH16 family)